MEIFDVLNWLKQFDRSRCGMEMGNRISQILAAPRDQQLMALIRQTIAKCRSSNDSMEQAEVFLTCSAVLYDWGGVDRLQEACTYANEALRLYEADAHREALSNWILGMVEWQLASNSSAYGRWYRARSAFKILHEERCQFIKFKTLKEIKTGAAGKNDGKQKNNPDEALEKAKRLRQEANRKLDDYEKAQKKALKAREIANAAANANDKAAAASSLVELAKLREAAAQTIFEHATALSEQAEARLQSDRMRAVSSSGLGDVLSKWMVSADLELKLANEILTEVKQLRKDAELLRGEARRFTSEAGSLNTSSDQIDVSARTLTTIAQTIENVTSKDENLADNLIEKISGEDQVTDNLLSNIIGIRESLRQANDTAKWLHAEADRISKNRQTPEVGKAARMLDEANQPSFEASRLENRARNLEEAAQSFLNHAELLSQNVKKLEEFILLQSDIRDQEEISKRLKNEKKQKEEDQNRLKEETKRLEDEAQSLKNQAIESGEIIDTEKDAKTREEEADSLKKQADDLIRQAILAESIDQEKNWYKKRVADMNAEMVGLVEEAYTWFDVCEESSLSEPARLIAGSILKNIYRKRFSDASGLIPNLNTIVGGLDSEDILNPRTPLSTVYDRQRGRKNNLEIADALAESALAYAQMGNNAEAIRCLNQGIARARHRSHEQAVMRWMMGLVQWRVPSEREYAIRNCLASIEDFKELKTISDQKNNPRMMNWYATQLFLMKDYLNERTDQFFSERS